MFSLISHHWVGFLSSAFKTTLQVLPYSKDASLQLLPCPQVARLFRTNSAGLWPLPLGHRQARWPGQARHAWPRCGPDTERGLERRRSSKSRLTRRDAKAPPPRGWGGWVSLSGAAAALKASFQVRAGTWSRRSNRVQQFQRWCLATEDRALLWEAGPHTPLHPGWVLPGGEQRLPSRTPGVVVRSNGIRCENTPKRRSLGKYILRT